MILLTSDWHLTDNPNDEYRWAVFDRLARWVEDYPDSSIGSPAIYMLGDLTDRKDRHSAALVNRVTTEFCRLIDLGASIWVLMGNHDMPLNGVPFWQFLDNLRPSDDLASGVSFITKPHASDSLVLLPYADDPATAWESIDFKKYKAAFMHQTVTGAIGNNGHELENARMPRLPKSLKVYSGDIHTTQTIKNVTYVGAPHPVAFGDDYPPQMMELDSNFEVNEVIKVKTIQKLMLRISYTAELEKVKTRGGDQARVICKLDLADLDKWPATQDRIVTWARARGVKLFSVEPEIAPITLAKAAEPEAGSELRENDPEYILRLFADAEGIDDKMFEAGIDMLKEVG